MGRVSKDAVLGGSNLPSKEIEVPELGGSILIQRLPAAFAMDNTELTDEGEGDGAIEIAVRENDEPLSLLMFAYGVKDPEFSIEEAREFASRYDTLLFGRIVREIAEMSEVDDASVKAAEARFPDGGDSGSTGDPDGGS